MRVFIFGQDVSGWSIDSDREYTELFLNDLGIKVTKNLIFANVIHAVWWNILLSSKYYPLRFKKIIAVVTNDIDVSSSEFLRAKKIVDMWIAPNLRVLERLEKKDVNVRYQPFYVDENIFFKLNKDKEVLAKELGLDYDMFRDKFIIGSFQRDSLGENLNEPKPQKGPDILIEILERTFEYHKNIILLLAGPRRHWIINECNKLGIPYYYYGKDPKDSDDIYFNILDKKTMNKLYNFIDLYIVSSRNEGGPKAILESSLAKKMIISTKVGLADDFLHSWCLYNNPDEAVRKIDKIINLEDFSKYINFNYNQVYSRASYKPIIKQWGDIYDAL